MSGHACNIPISTRMLCFGKEKGILEVADVYVSVLSKAQVSIVLSIKEACVSPEHLS